MLRALLLAPLLAACSVNPPAPDLIDGDDAVLVVSQLRIPDGEPWYSRFAKHTWFDVRHGGQWLRYEVRHKHSGVERTEIFPEQVVDPERWDRAVDVLHVVRGEKAAEASLRLDDFVDGYDDSVYRAWPGPNSNTFAEKALRAMKVGVELDHNAVGKDWAWLRVGRSGTGSGVELETAVAGVQVGLEEGIELHLLQLCAGVDVWPPALKLPFLPRIGWR